jgi:hypothetical protein
VSNNSVALPASTRRLARRLAPHDGTMPHTGLPANLAQNSLKRQYLTPGASYPHPPNENFFFLRETKREFKYLVEKKK